MRLDAKTITLTVVSLLVLSLLSQVSFDIPMSQFDIPITGQTFGVLLLATIMPRAVSAISILLYVMMGALGLPVFSEGSSGISVLMGNSGGYILGFVIATLYVGRKQSSLSSFNDFLSANILGTIIILFAGFLRLSYLKGSSVALDYGIIPFLPGGVIKIFLGAIAGYYLHVLLEKRVLLWPNIFRK